MKKSKLIFILILLFAVFVIAVNFTSCKKSTEPDFKGNPANAYFLVFEKLYEESTGLNSDIKYIAIDLTGAKLKEKPDLIKLFEKFCEENNYTLWQDTIQGLKEKGYIVDEYPVYFPDGFVISFKDDLLEDNKLVTKGSKWRSDLGAYGATYTAEKINGEWEVTNIADGWKN